MGVCCILSVKVLLVENYGRRQHATQQSIELSGVVLLGLCHVDGIGRPVRISCRLLSGTRPLS